MVTKHVRVCLDAYKPEGVERYLRIIGTTQGLSRFKLCQKPDYSEIHISFGVRFIQFLNVPEDEVESLVALIKNETGIPDRDIKIDRPLAV